MDHPLRLHRTEFDIRPWRLAVATLALVAFAELVLLVVAGGALLSKPREAVAEKQRPVAAGAATTTDRSPSRARAAVAGLPRRKVGVIVLNGNGRQGAAGAAATRVTRRGYRVRLVGNAPESSYPQSIVMYRPGFAGEGTRLARDLQVRVVSPLDGMRPKQLRGAHVVLILGG